MRKGKPRQSPPVSTPAAGQAGRPPAAGELPVLRPAIEGALPGREELYSILSELPSDFAYTLRVEPDGTFVPGWVTEGFSRIGGLRPDEELLRDWERLVHPDDRHPLLESMATVLAGQPGERELRLVTRGEGTRWVHTYSRPVRDEAQGRVARIYGAAQDITDRKRLEAQFLQSQKMETMGRLAGGVAHDFNNYLTAIRGYAGLARNALRPGDPVRDDIEQVLKAAERAAALTSQLLAFSRRQIIEPRVVNLNDLILDMDKMLRRLIGEDIELVVLPAPDLGLVRVDPAQIEQALVNLVVNARDAMSAGGILTIETTNVVLGEDWAVESTGMVPGSFVTLSVRDTGVGMTEEVKAHLFEPFFTTKEVGHGTGLGLATVYGIVRQNQGFVSVSSELGRGTTVQILLPRGSRGRAKRRSGAAKWSTCPGGTRPCWWWKTSRRCAV